MSDMGTINSFYVLQDAQGRYVDREGGTTWARAYARVFPSEAVLAYLAGDRTADEPSTVKAIEVDADGNSVFRRKGA